MARQEIITITDDLDNTPGATTHTFALDGVTYEIDLSGANAEKLASLLAPFVSKARKVKATHVAVIPRGGAVPYRRGGNVKANTKEHNAAAREWLAANGYKGELKERGRIPQALLDAYATKTPKSDPLAQDALFSNVEKEAPAIISKEQIVAADQAAADAPKKAAARKPKEKATAAK